MLSSSWPSADEDHKMPDAPLDELRRFLSLPQPLKAVSLGSWPSPVAPLQRLGEALGASLWIKRDDRCAVPYGGNKVRKLELLLGEAQARRSKSLITVGGIGSHQIIATAVHGRKIGLATYAAVYPQPVTPEAMSNLQLSCALGVHLFPFRESAELAGTIGRISDIAPAPSYLIPAGGSSPAGNIGYLAAALELDQQIRAGQLPVPDDIFVPLGSGGTAAGLALGCALARLPSRVVGVRVAGDDVINAAVVRHQITAMTDHLSKRLKARLPRMDGPVNLHVEDGYAGERYGQPTVEGTAAIAMARDMEAIGLDPTYSGKAMAAMIDHSKRVGSGRRVLFWSTYNGYDMSEVAGTLRVLEDLPAQIKEWIS
jgi:1-aminocyclopropane-1-carboxylate deaminase/D-cysteine desulfhydrase-like pyridoxal-dependent ACC family enzyme